jgi:putative transferase (TIGR04331 family)
MHCNFFEALKEINLNHKILIRLKSGFVLRNLEEEYYQQSGLTNFVYSDEESLLDSISRSELIIVTYDSTVFLESLTLNKPTCLFIRKDFWEMSKESVPYFEDFVACGILHYDETSLAQHVLKIQDDYSLWWQSDLVQHSVNAFLKKFGLSNDDWDEDWYNEINTYLKINK